MTIYTIIHSIVSILLIITIVLQHRASGLSATFGGTGESVVQRRGAEKVIYKFTIILAIVFFSMTVLQWYIY